jgi:rhodanese-related sulfurtransferase
MLKSFLSRFGGSKTPVGKMTVEELKEQLAANPKLVLIDVREPHEYAGGHVKRARLLPLSQIRSRSDEVPHDVPLAVICRTGNRSRTAAKVLAGDGFDQVFNVSGGMMAWSRAGFPISQGKSRPPRKTRRSR